MALFPGSIWHLDDVGPRPSFVIFLRIYRRPINTKSDHVLLFVEITFLSRLYHNIG